MTEPVFDIDGILHPDERARFGRLCIPTDVGELPDLLETVRLHHELVLSESRPSTDLEMADRIAGTLETMITSGDTYDDVQRALLRGAVEYFLLADDADSDIEDPLGFDDDARMVNLVAAHLGRGDLVIDF